MRIIDLNNDFTLKAIFTCVKDNALIYSLNIIILYIGKVLKKVNLFNFWPKNAILYSVKALET